MSFAQICGDWLSIARRQTGGIATLCRGFVNEAGTVKTREDGLSELINTPHTGFPIKYLSTPVPNHIKLLFKYYYHL